MRTFYLFKIKTNYSILTKNNPYNLYKTLEEIYHLKKDEIKIAYDLFSQIRDTFNKELLDNNIYEYYKNRYTYTKINNTHIINDYYTEEKSKLVINPSYLLIRSTKQIPTFLRTITKKNNIFVCDFDNIDYFWLDELN